MRWVCENPVCAAALLSARLRFSVVPLLILAGMVVGPHAQTRHYRLALHPERSLTRIHGTGILFLLFYLGLRVLAWSFDQGWTRVVVGGTIYIALNFGLGWDLPG